MTEADNLVLFDGVCNFCNASVQFLIARERKPTLKFASLQSETGQHFIKTLNVKQGENGSVVYIKNGKAYTKSTAALLLTLRFKGLWPLLSIFLIIPWFIRDLVYDYIARNRYKWWGKTESCQLPSPELRKRFIDL